jgi:alanine dehydrogenase
MSEVAGRLGLQEGMMHLEKHRGGKGILLGGVPGVKPAKVLVLGAGIAGTAAAKNSSRYRSRWLPLRHFIAQAHLSGRHYAQKH